MKNIFTSFTKSVLVALGLTTAALAAETSIQKKIFRSSLHHLDLAKQSKLTISNKKMDDIIKVVRFVENNDYW